jgi:hypothetical protein
MGVNGRQNVSRITRRKYRTGTEESKRKLHGMQKKKIRHENQTRMEGGEEKLSNCTQKSLSLEPKESLLVK